MTTNEVKRKKTCVTGGGKGGKGDLPFAPRGHAWRHAHCFFDSYLQRGQRARTRTHTQTQTMWFCKRKRPYFNNHGRVLFI